MGNPELIDLLESEINLLIQKSHNSGLNYWQILDEFLRACVNLHIKASAEYQLQQRG